MYIWDLVWGKFLFKKRFSTDNRLIRGLRGAFAIMGILALALLAFYNIVVQPLGSGGSSGIKTFKMPVQGSRRDYPSPLYTLSDLAKTIFLVLPGGTYIPREAESSAVSVHGTWTDNSQSKLDCFAPVPHGPENATTGQFIISCSPLNETTYAPVPSTGDIFITLNFSSFAPAMSLDPHIQLYLAGSVALDDLISTNEPVYISPGSHLRGLGIFSIREQLSNPRAAAIGVLQYKRSVVINIHALSTDSSPGNQSEDSNLATLWVSLPPLQEVYVEQEYYENSAINGLAFLGGVWTFLNGFFAAVFGNTLLLVLFGIKPLSIYGLVHTFQQQRSSLVDGDHVLSSGERDRIVTVLSAHLLDIEDGESDGLLSGSSTEAPRPYRYESLNA
ncbi:hypothetical protein P691DRAFT_779477 [Macrolepiota fuliginosa MF-IS2]|uniref:Uncharacterized protein n=1 Tax=Macrolepiota fuliginosa MF-IS2 TaxID=1400762 RepID=A0A9P6BY98_9AGAR|nr:hypothetical protein P691DRAFT_779477 [Macrolepiota fuliginosa MF-IS2]